MAALILIVVGTVLVALSVVGIIGARAKSRTLLLIVRRKPLEAVAVGDPY